MAPALNLDTLVLERGAHDAPDKGFCVMEAVAYVAGEPFSDHPECTSPDLAGGWMVSAGRSGEWTCRL